eukprot:CAMPEP_0194545936 /NCGR_PEP_ID=MMETSP0253-20130528/89915_1 /TAXON_ID=2966 /ORGANISM="Noctiluca scintillans" /LENGTH=45 /DNA_ID= /DNA_START= /DNA_END= /DNA_ORIENTATION=
MAQARSIGQRGVDTWPVWTFCGPTLRVWSHVDGTDGVLHIGLHVT